MIVDNEFLMSEIRDLRIEVIQMYSTLKKLDNENKILKKETAWIKDRLLTELEPWLIEVQNTAEQTPDSCNISRETILKIIKGR